jgi:hypothetical protein
MRSPFKLFVAFLGWMLVVPTLAAAGVPRVIVAEMFGAVW